MVDIFLITLASIFLALPALIIAFVASVLAAIVVLITLGLIGGILFYLISLLIAAFS